MDPGAVITDIDALSGCLFVMRYAITLPVCCSSERGCVLLRQSCDVWFLYHRKRHDFEKVLPH